MKQPYHSALQALPPTAAPPCARFEHRGSVAFVHDLLAGPAQLPPEFRACDVLWLEPPWPHGYREFYRRAGAVPALPFAAFLERIRDLIHASSLPAVCIAGRRSVTLLQPEQAVPLRHNGAPALAALWRLQPPALAPRTDSRVLLSWLAERFACVGDFVAGYGRSGRAFAARGRRFVLTDLNPHCIGHIARAAPEWFHAHLPERERPRSSAGPHGPAL